ncbi:hypothetical protein IJI55_00665 [Candidatus Saccharibacteria bacterium]|nr:hypothetical protein [Candidatus Saccharibacteria bacterium]MBR3323855.1 hypothetical protein [Candidatus Saccharibacteria bacterium]
MTNKVKTLVMSAALVAAGALGVAAPVSATTVFCPDGTTASDLSNCSSIRNENNQNNLMQVLNTIINVVIGVVGFLAVVMVIYGGIQYTTSAGAADKVKSAKDTIMYGIIGLIVALLAFAIVNFVLGNIFK